ncbi:hypothetical protein CBR_g41661 [Chara braunii]|uniref:Glycosyltransferase RgtA/B/C/D-like domain-containing protein n=1 Tax=Chara braunii TaxID=69332 RepID=A0A388LWB3_CHABU|nr:hypothetical protein CBR_g41661 [Chara braunii]|eukprot:GBG86596.1 hypothetical protein CBR_g41661 [Chara braunii]
MPSTMPLTTSIWGPTAPVVDLACGQRRTFHGHGHPQCLQACGIVRQCLSEHKGWTRGDQSSVCFRLFSGRKSVTWQGRCRLRRAFGHLDGVTWLPVDGHGAMWQNAAGRRIPLSDLPRRAGKDGRPTGAGSPSRPGRAAWRWRRAALGGEAMDEQKREEGEEEGGQRKVTMEDESSQQRRFSARGAPSATVEGEVEAEPLPDGGRTTGQRACAGGGVKLAEPVVRAFAEPWERAIVAIIGIGILWSAAWLCNLGAAGLVDDTEPLFAEAARQMVVTGDWITPQFNAQPRFDKPVLIYWLMAGSVKLFGDHVWALRLPSAVCGAVTSLAIATVVFRFGLSLSPDRACPSDEKPESTAHQVAMSNSPFSVSSVPHGRIAAMVIAIVAFVTSIEHGSLVTALTTVVDLTGENRSRVLAKSWCISSNRAVL